MTIGGSRTRESRRLSKAAVPTAPELRRADVVHRLHAPASAARLRRLKRLDHACLSRASLHLSLADLCPAAASMRRCQTFAFRSSARFGRDEIPRAGKERLDRSPERTAAAVC